MRQLVLPIDFDADSAPTRNLQNGPKVLRREWAGSTEVFRTASVGAADLFAPRAVCLRRECPGVVYCELVAA